MNDVTKNPPRRYPLGESPRRIWKEIKQDKIHIDTGRLKVIRPTAKEISVSSFRHHLSKTVCNAEI